MGSPLGPTLANLLLANYENKWLENCPLQFPPKYYRRYDDGILLILEKKDQMKHFLRDMTLCHPNIKFTCEEEVSNKFGYMCYKN